MIALKLSIPAYMLVFPHTSLTRLLSRSSSTSRAACLICSAQLSASVFWILRIPLQKFFAALCAAPARSIRTTVAFPPRMDLLSDSPPPLDTAGVAAETAMCAGAPFRLKVFSSVRTDLNGRLIIRLPLFLPFLIMVQLPAAFFAKPPPAPGFAALLDRRPASRAFVDRRVRAVPHPAFAAGEFLPRDVAGWNKALPTVQA